MPQNLPGFGLTHDNRSQQANVTWTRIVSPSLVNTATVAFSRLAMTHYEENSFTNDIVGQLGIQGVGFGGPRAWGAPYFNVQGYSPFGDTYQATPMQMWDTILEGRDTVSLQRGHHSLKLGGSYRRFIWPMWAYVLSRGYYQFTNGYTTRTATRDGTGSALASFLLGLAGGTAAPGRIAAHESAPVVCRRVHPGHVSNHAAHDSEPGVALRIHESAGRLSNDWAGLFVSPTALTGYIGGQLGTPRGLLYTNKTRFAPRFGLPTTYPKGDSSCAPDSAFSIRRST